jgi:hypothetical protein
MSTMKNRARKIAALVAVLAVVCPVTAWAAIRMQNFARSDINTSGSCIAQEPGGNALTFTNDATGPLLTVNSATSVIGDATMLQTTVTAEGNPGERTVYPDVLRIRNNCNYPGTATLILEPDFAANAAATGAWTDLNMSLHLSAIAPPIATADLSVAASWNPTAAVVTAGSVTAANSGSVTIAAGARLQIALVVDAGTSVSTASPATLRWTTQVTI